MTRIEWFYAKEGRQFGPVSTLEMKQMADAGKLAREDLVWRDGMKGWVAARKVGGLFPEMPRGWATDPAGAMAGPPSSPTGSASSGQLTPAPVASPPIAPPLPPSALEESRHALDPFLRSAREKLGTEFVDATSAMFARIGNGLLYAAMLLWLALNVVIGTRQETSAGVVQGLLGVMILGALQFSARRCCEALDRLNQRTAGRMSSPSLADSFVLLNLAFGVALLILFAALALSQDMIFLAHGVAAFIVFQFAAIVSLNPESLGITIRRDTGVRDEAIGAAAFLLKLGARVVPVAFGVGVAVGTIKLLYASYLLFAGPGDLTGLTELIDADGAALAPAAVVTFEAGITVAFYALLPLVAYLLFLAGYLLLDFVRAVVYLPGKLDRLAPKGEGEPPTGKTPSGLR